MYKLLKTNIIFFLLILISASAPAQHFAQSEKASSDFSTEYNVTYIIREDGITDTQIDVVLTNKTSQFFASSYTLQVGFDDIQDVTAEDAGGQLAPKITKNEAGHAISLQF